jgi:hypothetical protein
MTELQPVTVTLDVKLDPGETVHAEPVGREFHIIATLANGMRRLIGRVIPMRPRPVRNGWGTALHGADLVDEMAWAEPPKQKGR